MRCQETGVHVITVNDYLAKRDAQWMAPLYQALGLSIGVIQSFQGLQIQANSFSAQPGMTRASCNPVPDNRPMVLILPMAPTMNLALTICATIWPLRLEDKTQRGLAFAIIDEVDSNLN